MAVAPDVMPVGGTFTVVAPVIDTIDDCAFDGICALVLDTGAFGEVPAIWASGMIACQGQLEDGIVIGDTVEVYGEVLADNQVTICTAPEYYIKKIQ